MSDENKAPDGPESAQPMGRTRMVTVKLRDLPNPAEILDDYAFRFPDKYTEASLSDLIESIKLYKGLYEAPQIVKRPDGRLGIVCGHRRIASHYILVKKGISGFTLDMEITCVELMDSPPVALMVRSMSTNELGMKLEPKERLIGVKRMDELGGTKKDIATAARVSEKSIERDLKIVRNPRVLQHVMDDNLSTSVAAAIVEVAKGRLDEFLDYFDTWALEKLDQIEKEDRRAKQERGKGLKPNQMQVAGRIEPHVVRGWIDALAKGKPLMEERDLGFEASFDKRSYVATIKLRVDTRNAPVDFITRAAAQASQVAKYMAAFAQKRVELEGMGAQAALQKDEDFLDRDLLSQFGLENLIQLENEENDEESPPEHPPQDVKEGEAKDNH